MESSCCGGGEVAYGGEVSAPPAMEGVVSEGSVSHSAPVDGGQGGFDLAPGETLVPGSVVSGGGTAAVSSAGDAVPSSSDQPAPTPVPDPEPAKKKANGKKKAAAGGDAPPAPPAPVADGNTDI